MIDELTKRNVTNQSTYVDVPVSEDGLSVIINQHLQYMNGKNIRLPAIMEQLPLMCIGHPSYIRSLMVADLWQPQTDVPLNLYLNPKHCVYP